jgi:hypothetical protein
LNAAYQVLDHAGRVYDAANVPCTYNEQFPVGTTSKNKFSLPGFGQKHKNDTGTVPNSTEDVKQILIHNVVGQIAAKLGNTTTSVEVQVATGDSHLDRAAEFLENKLWARALDELEKTPPFEKRDQEAYRQYDLGVAYEAISYTSASADDAKENIFKAAEYYDKAVEMNTKEKYFVATVARTRDALARYKEIEAQNRVPSKSAHPDATPDPDARARATVPSAVAETTAKPEQAGKMLTVADVIEMYTNKVPQDQIIDVIQGSTVDFNPRDKDTAIAIAKAGLPVRLQNALRAKVGAPPLKAPAPKTVPTKT